MDGQPLKPQELGRIAAHIAKQLITQKIREAESDVLYEEFRPLVGRLMRGTVQRIERGNVIVALEKTEGVLSSRERIPGENYRPGQTLRFLVKDVTRTGQKVRVELTRLGEEFLDALFYEEVPELKDGLVEVVRIARDAGHRSKVAVRSLDPRVDAVGTCVGVKGARIRAVVDELAGERIDIVGYSDDPEEYVVRALKLDGPLGVAVDGEHKVAYVTVPQERLSVAIGRHGQNVRLASELTGWQIEIAPEEVELDIPGVPAEALESLRAAGYETMEDLKQADVEDLTEAEGVTEEMARKLKEYVAGVEERLLFGEETEELSLIHI